MNRKVRRQESRKDGVAGRNNGIGLTALAATYRAQGRPREAVKLLKQMLAREPRNAAAHGNIAMAYQALGRRDHAMRHFSQAIAFGLRGAGTLMRESPAMIAAIGRLARAYPRELPLAELLGAGNAVADDARLLALLQSEIICDVEIELFLTAVRRELLVTLPAAESSIPDENVSNSVARWGSSASSTNTSLP